MRRIAGAATVFAAAAAALGLWFKTQGRDHPSPRSLSAFSTPLMLGVDGTEAEVTYASGIAHVQAGERSQLEGVKRVSTGSGSTAHIEVPAHAPRAGLKIIAGPDSEIAITRASREFGLELLHLSRGHLDVEVPKLQPGTSFVVVTPSVRAFVVGTAFSLTASPSQEQDSCVRVREGVVRVERAQPPHTELARVSAGQAWGCEQAASDQVAEPHPQQNVARRGTRPGAKPASSTPSGTLAEETALLARAVRANQRQDHSAAERDLEKLLEEYPHSPLAAEARRLLQQLREGRPKVHGPP